MVHNVSDQGENIECPLMIYQGFFKNINETGAGVTKPSQDVHKNHPRTVPCRDEPI